jgi:hypothetical protein
MKRTYEKLTAHDKMSVDFCRCLYQAKAIVKELQSFGDSVCPAMNIYPEFIQSNKLDGPLVLQQVRKYFDTTFQKFNRLCQILLMVLSKMESKSTSLLKKERIDSFRSEVWDEWNTATFIKQRLLHSIHSSPSEAEHHHLLIRHSNNNITTTMTTTTSLASAPNKTTTTTTTTKTRKPFQCTSA